MNEINEIKIPAGVESISVERYDDRIVIELAPKVPRFKNGDFVYEDGRIMIVKSDPANFHALVCPFLEDRADYDDTYGLDFSEPTFRYATYEEKQMLIDAMKKDGKRWNVEKKCVEDITVYKDGDFVVNDVNEILIFKEADGYRIFDHAYLPAYGGLVIDKVAGCGVVKRHATTEEKQRMIDALAERGKRWNKDKKCIEDIPKRKFKAGDVVRIKDGISSKTHSNVSCSFSEDMDKYIGQKLVVAEVLDNTQYGIIYIMTNDLYTYAEDWLEPWSDEPKNGDLAIFWDDNKDRALIRIYNRKGYSHHSDSYGHLWENAIKFESKKQFEEMLKGQI